MLFLALAAALAGTEPLELSGDPALQMVDGIQQYLVRATAESPKNRRPDRERLRYILGVVDQRVALVEPEIHHELARTPAFVVRAARWPVLDGITAEGIVFEPAAQSRGCVVAVPDADQPPERFGAAQHIAATGFTVVVPALINRADTYSGNPAIRMTNQPHREWVYRMTYPIGRHVIGFEVQKILGAVDWCKATTVWGYGEGGGLALYAAALDARIQTVGVSGYFGPRESIAREPIYRNVWGLLRDFGDAELAALIAPRKVIVDPTPGPVIAGRQPPAAPGELRPFERGAIEAEMARAGALGASIAVGKLDETPAVDIPLQDANARQRRAIREIETYCLRLIERSDAERMRAWKRDGPEAMRKRLRNDLIGELPRDATPARPRSREIAPGRNWRGYEVILDAAPGVIAYGVLLVPNDLKRGEKRAAVVMQHGLDGRPQDLFNQTSGRARDVYQNVGQTLVDAGFVVYLPQNPYIHDFRPISRLANPLGLTLFSFILRQHERTVEWLQSLPFVDASRIGFYGLSYGGKTALRVPPLLPAYAVTVCSGDFNEWVRKLTTTTEPYSYMFTREYEILEFDLAHIASHAEMAMLTAPRPFMVERGHGDGVGIDEWVSYEYAKVRRFYTQQGLTERTEIAFFDGPHRIDGRASVEFLKRFLKPRP